MMTGKLLLQSVLVFGPILLLLMVGIVVVIRSGLVGLDTTQSFRRVAGNISQLAVLLVACAAFLLAIQEVVGFNLRLFP